MPYRIDVPNAPDNAFELLADLGALDIEPTSGGIAAVMPDGVPADRVAGTLQVRNIVVSNVQGRDDDSVWTLAPRSVQVGSMTIVPAGGASTDDAVILSDGPAFGTGLHPTTALCLAVIDDLLADRVPARLLDVGTGSGILALAALKRGVPIAAGVDIDTAALRVATDNARLNGLSGRFLRVHGDVDAVGGAWPLVVANIRAAELIEMAPSLVRRVSSQGTLVLSGIAAAVAPDVSKAYRRLGVTQTMLGERDGWTVLTFRSSW